MYDDEQWGLVPEDEEAVQIIRPVVRVLLFICAVILIPISAYLIWR